MESKIEETDRLSSLPDSILVHILSFLPTQDAVRTLLIKKSFSTLWTLLPSLDLEDAFFDFWDDCDEDEDDGDGDRVRDLPFFIFVRNVLINHKRPEIEKFRVNFTTMLYYDIERRNLGHELGSWINFALRKQVKILEFIFGMVEPCFDLFKWPHPEFVSYSLVELRLEFLNLNSLTRVQLGSLRILRLISVELSESLLGEIIRGSPYLKELEIYNCDVSMLSFAAPNVEKLIVDISYCSFYCGEEDDYGPYAIINCPNLQCFEFTGFVDFLDVIDLSSLVQVTFNLMCRRPVFKEFPKFITVLNTFVCAESVSFSWEFVTVLFYCLVKDLPQMSVNWKRAKLSIWLTEKHVYGLNCMLRNSPYLEELVVDVTRCISDYMQPIESQLGDDALDGEGCWRCLKSIVIHNIAESSYAVLVCLTELLLKKALVLSELVFYYKGKERLEMGLCNLTSEQLVEFSQKLSKFSRASQHVKILIL